MIPLSHRIDPSACKILCHMTGVLTELRKKKHMYLARHISPTL